MKTREFAEIVIKILAVYVLFVFLTSIPVTMSMLEMCARMGRGDVMAGPGSNLTFLTVAVGMMPFAYLVFAGVLFWGARKLSCLFVQNSEGQISFSGPVSNDVLTFAFRCLGVYAVVTWGPDFIQKLTRIIIYSRLQTENTVFLRRFYDSESTLISSTLGTLLGLFLIFKATGLLRLIRLSYPAASKENGGNHG